MTWGLRPTLTGRLRRIGTGEAKHINLPTLAELLIQTTTLDSSRSAGELQEGIDLYLKPPIQAFDLLDWKAIYKLVDIGYDHAREQLSRWISTNPSVQQRNTPGYRPFAKS